MEKHRCRICSKCFPSGRSLGGHMRSHMQFHSAEAGAKKKKLAGQVGGFGEGCELGENTKKMGRLSDLGEHHPASSAHGIERKQCKECGKMFPSSKALFGHMRSHSHKISRPSSVAEETREQDHLEQDQEDEEEGSWSQKKFSQVSISDDNALSTESRWNHRMNLESSAIHAAAAAAASSSSITAYEQEQADVAISLMMLSRDVSSCWAPSTESSDEHTLVLEDGELKQRSESEDLSSEHLEEEEAADSGDEPKRRKTLNLGEFGGKKVRVDKKGKYLNAQGSELGRSEPKLESTHQCTSCNRAFHSYQALGGHRASHKRIRGCCLPKPCAIFDGTEDCIEQLKSENNEAPHPCQSNRSRIHECSICGKTFFSGQALGGHKRSHVVVPNAGGSSQSDEVAESAADEVKVPELLDLNCPAPIDEESSNVKLWMACEQHLVDLITNRG